jgi:dipeptidyl-peptidase-4
LEQINLNLITLVLTKPFRKMRKKGCIFIILLFIFIAHAFSQQTVKKIQLEEAIGTRKFFPENVEEIRSLNDGEHYTILVDYAFIIRYNYANGLATDTLFSKKHFPGISELSGYEFNNDESKILISTNEDKIYRHSFLADYYVFDVRKSALTQVSDKGKQQLATFSPSGDKIAFMRQNNIYMVDITTNKETQLTFDGKHNEIINGAPDWVYEEEFGFNKGFEWSPDGQKLAYMRFDESNVKMYTLPIYDQLYPTLDTYKYPKAGEKNSTVSIYVYNLINSKNQMMDVGKDTDQYIPRIKWTKDANTLGILRLNRLQNKIDLLLADVRSGKSNVIFTEKNKYYIDEVQDNTFTFLEDGQHFVVFSERNGFKHLYLYSISGKLINQITRGAFDVDELLGINQQQNTLYYTSTEASPLDRSVYVIKMDGTGKRMLSSKKGTNSAEFSKNFGYFINTWSDANTPPEVILCDASRKTIRILKSNDELKKRIMEYGFGKKEFITLPTKEGLQLNGYIIKPRDFDSLKKYPVLIYVYGGPESQNVTNEWDKGITWFQILVQEGFLVVCVDNRGTDGRGEEFKKCTYMQLGKFETEDQISAARYLAGLPYIDGSRIGIFGWSYGGYMASLCLTKGADFFKLGIAVAPVTNWRFYDTIYTERFMRKPQDNPSGYDDNSPINFADRLKGKFLLIHGSADDNVHLQNTMEFAKKLVLAGKQFDMAIYADKNHNISGPNSRLNLYTKMTDFLMKNL